MTATGILAIVPEAPPRWVRDGLEAVAADLDQAVHVTRRWGARPPHDPPGPLARRLSQLYRRLDRARFVEPDGPLRPLEGLDPWGVAPDEGPRPCSLAISFVGREAALEIADLARWGCLYLDFDADAFGWTGYREFVGGRPGFVTRIRLLRRAGGRLVDSELDRHRSRTHRLSLHRTREVHAAKLPLALVRAARRAREKDTEAARFGSPPEERAEASPTASAERGTPRGDDGGDGIATEALRPGVGSLARLTGSLLARKAGSLATRACTHRQWLLGVRRGAGTLDRILAGGPLGPLETLEPPRDRFWADPFPVSVEGGHVIFIEEYLYESGRAHIACFRLRDQEHIPAPVPVLEAPHHLSYPFVFEWGGDWFMLPEASAGGSLLLYRAADFPHGWEPVAAVLERGAVADATLFELEGTWWLFAVLQGDRPESWDENLHLYRADTPFGPWRPHRRNPVLIDAGGARPAGRLIRHGSLLLRPGQDCVSSYGRAIVLHEVLELTASSYRERAVARLEPDWLPGLVGTHTLNSCPGLTTVDGVRRRIGPRPAR